MATVTFSTAAKRAGFKSRSTLYRLRDDGRLAAYLRDGTKGFPVLELEPEGHPPLLEWLAGCVRLRADNMHRQPRRQPPAPADPLEALERKISRLEHELAAAHQREEAWLSAYRQLREWVVGEIPEAHMTYQLLEQLPDPSPVGEVLVLTRSLVLDRLKSLDTVEMASRFRPGRR